MIGEELKSQNDWRPSLAVQIHDDGEQTMLSL